MNIATICFIHTGERVLLGMKKQGFGKDKWNGFGGKVEKGESIESAVVREVHEECGLNIHISDLKKAAILNFYFAGKQKFETHVFLAEKWSGDPIESDEMLPRWHTISLLPFENMWVADRIWVPLVLRGKKLKAEVYFNQEGTALEKPPFIEEVA